MMQVLSFGLPLLLIVYLPFLQDPYDTGRWIVLCITTLLLLLFAAIGIIRTKKIPLVKTPFAYGLGALTIASVISLFVSSTNKIEVLVHPLGPITYCCLFFLSLLLPSLLSKKQKHYLLWSLVFVIGFLGLVIIYQQFHIASIMFPGAMYLQSTLWNPTGTPISALLLFCIGIPLAIFLTIDAFHHHKERSAATILVLAIFMVLGLGITMWRFVPLIKTVLMPLSVGWRVLLEALKQPKGAFFGVGAENFASAFALGKGTSINQTDLWNTSFSTSATLFFHVATTLGLVGCLAFFGLGISWFFSMPKQRILQIVWVIAAVALFFFPPSVAFLLCLVLLESTQSQEPDHTYSLPLVIRIGIFAVTLACIGIASFFLFRFVMGEYHYTNARLAAETENNLTKSYAQHILAIQQNPFLVRYHLSLSQLALVMGGSILGSAPKNDQTGLVTLLDDDKTLVTSLFGLAVSEAKLATSLAPTHAAVWTNLATIYQSLIGIAVDAQTWTAAAYQKALTVNPTSPTLRVDVGGMYMNAKDYDNAITQFFTAVTLRQTYTNAYYNLANAYKAKGDTERAIEALKITRDLLPKQTKEFDQVTAELTALGARQDMEATASGQTTHVLSPTPTRKPLIDQTK